MPPKGHGGRGRGSSNAGPKRGAKTKLPKTALASEETDNVYADRKDGQDVQDAAAATSDK